MAKHGRPQLIEVIPLEPARLPATPTGARRSAPQLPGGPPRGSDGDAPSPGHRWWIAPAAVAAIAAVVVGVALASDSTSSRPTNSTLGSAPASSPVAPAVLPLVPQTPTGYAIRSVTTATHDSAPAPVVRELWATHPTAQTSSWLEITAGTSLDLATNVGDARIAVPAGVAVFRGQADGLLTVSGPIPGGQATISSSAVSQATMAELFASMRLDHGALVHGDPRLGGMFQEIGSDPAGTADPAQSAANDHGATLTVVYGSIDDTAQQRQDFDVTVGPVPAGFDETVRRFFLSRATEVTVDGQQSVIGSDVRTVGAQSVVFQRAGLQISISGTAPRDVLLGALQSIHVATGTELAALMAVPPAAPVDGAAAVPANGWVPFASGSLSDGRRWTLRAGSADGGAISAIDLRAGEVDAPTPVDGRDSLILTLASPAYTALVAFIPRGMPGARLVVTVGGVEHDAEAEDVGGGNLLAGFAFDQLTAYSAQIVGPDGRVLSSAAG